MLAGFKALSHLRDGNELNSVDLADLILNMFRTAK